jgi:hypothetical protein
MTSLHSLSYEIIALIWSYSESADAHIIALLLLPSYASVLKCGKMMICYFRQNTNSYSSAFRIIKTINAESVRYNIFVKKMMNEFQKEEPTFKEYPNLFHTREEEKMVTCFPKSVYINEEENMREQFLKLHYTDEEGKIFKQPCKLYHTDEEEHTFEQFFTLRHKKKEETHTEYYAKHRCSNYKKNRVHKKCQKKRRLTRQKARLDKDEEYYINGNIKADYCLGTVHDHDSEWLYGRIKNCFRSSCRGYSYDVFDIYDERDDYYDYYYY